MPSVLCVVLMLAVVNCGLLLLALVESVALSIAWGTPVVMCESRLSSPSVT